VKHRLFWRKSYVEVGSEIAGASGVNMSKSELADYWFDLLAAIFKLALRDARKGDKSAKIFLRKTFPEWEQYI
jgi:hypothetical protein